MIQNFSFASAKLEDGNVEIQLKRNGVPRRFALCTHDNDAEVILEALTKLDQSERLIRMFQTAPGFPV